MIAITTSNSIKVKATSQLAPAALGQAPILLWPSSQEFVIANLRIKGYDAYYKTSHDKPPANSYIFGAAQAMNVAPLSAPDDATAGTGLPPVQSTERIGRYRLLKQIGEGGCGIVFLAQQEQPVRRRVALKVIKLGMDTRQVVARFEAERQALALMDHPNIAKVLDGGATESGRPYFVMELVDGIRITDYCDQNKFSTAERLKLFIRVCQAIEHAHQRGIVHRDLKPSNILVTLQDGVPVPKVIDFGIAKATTDQKLTDKTLFTAFDQFIGTPAYMSPEQAEMSGVDIDRRTDIYSLGVLLYELLTGKTPFDSKDLLEAGLDSLRRTIREREPLKPSLRLTTMLKTGLTGAAKHQRAELSDLIRQVRGDLDWIVLKAMEKDRTRRYGQANALAMDVQRYLAGQPVTARPPSYSYRLSKFIRRNKLICASALIVTVSLLIGLGLSFSLWSSRTKARERAATAIRDRERIRAQTKLTQFTALANDLRNQGRLAEAELSFRDALAIWEKLSGNQTPEVANLLESLAEVLRSEDKLAQAEAMLRENLMIRKRLRAVANPDATSGVNLVNAYNQLTDVLLAEEKFSEAEVLGRECLDLSETQLPGDWRTFKARSLLGASLTGLKQYAEAEPLLVSAYEGMNQRQDRIPRTDKSLKEAVDRIVHLYEAIGRNDQAAQWKKRLTE